MKTFAERLREAREKRGLSQTELADRLGVSQARISQLECGARENPTIDTIRTLATALKIPVMELIG